MRSRQNNRQLKRILYSAPALIILAVLLFLMTKAALGAYRKEAASMNSLRETRSEWQRLKDRELQLSSEVRELQTPRGLEEEIREKFSVAKEGEKLAIVVEGDKTKEETDVPERNFLQRLWDAIFRK